MTDRELINGVKKKDDYACKEIINKYHNLIFKIINSYSLNQGDYIISIDELYQEACIALYEACMSYCVVKNCQFSTFAYVVIKRRISKFISKQIDIYKHEYISYDKYDSADKKGIFENRYVCDNPIEYSNDIMKNDDLSEALSRLKIIDQKIIKMRLLNYSYDEISEKLNLSKKKIDNRLQYLKRIRFYRH